MATSSAVEVGRLGERVDNLVFDLDGTLIDSVPGIGSSLAEAFLSIGRTMPAADLRRSIGPPIGVISRRLEPSLSEDEVVSIEKAYRTSYDTNGWRQTVPFSGVAETLQVLHRSRYRLFVVTNKPRIPSEKILLQLGLLSLFQSICTRDTRTPPFSSKAEMLNDVMQQHKLNPASTVMIGDTSEDGEAAEANGIRFIYASYGYGSPTHAHLTIHDFSNLRSALLPNFPDSELHVKGDTVSA